MPTFIANFLSIYQHFNDSTGVVSRAMAQVNEAGGFAGAFAPNLGHVNPYGTFRLDMSQRLLIEAA